jgi:hypothetical protein
MTWNMEVGFERVFVSYEVLTAILLRIQVFCYTTQGRFVNTDISKESTSLGS